MARIKLLSADEVPEAAQSTYAAVTGYGPFASLAGAMAQRPPILNRIFGLLGDLRDDGVLDRRSLELVLVILPGAERKMSATYLMVAERSRMSSYPFIPLPGQTGHVPCQASLLGMAT